MAVTVRLMRFGKKKRPIYRIIVVDKRKKRDGKYIESIGSYDPFAKKPNISLNQEKFTSWLEKGALLSEGLARLLKNKKSTKSV